MRLAIFAMTLALAAQEKVDMAAMMAKAKKFTEPSAAHKALERLLGTWTIDQRFVMMGKEGKPEMGEQKCDWALKGRFIECRLVGQMMGKPMESRMIIGYDNFKMAYRMATFNTIDTAMNTAEGALTRDGKALVLYGTLDEYLTGEHDKMVKYAWRFDSPDAHRFEVHDLRIGEENSMVVLVRSTRKK